MSRRILIVGAILFGLLASLAILTCVIRADDARYTNCNNELIRVYDGADGYVRWGRPTAITSPEPTPGGWTDMPVPMLGRARIVRLERCVLTVAPDLEISQPDDPQRYRLAYLGDDVWELPDCVWTAFMPLVR